MPRIKWILATILLGLLIYNFPVARAQTFVDPAGDLFDAQGKPTIGEKFVDIVEVELTRTESKYAARIKVLDSLPVGVSNSSFFFEWDVLIDYDQNVGTHPWGSWTLIDNGIGVDALLRLTLGSGGYSGELLTWPGGKRASQNIDFCVEGTLVETRFDASTIGNPPSFNFVFAVRKYTGSQMIVADKCPNQGWFTFSGGKVSQVSATVTCPKLQNPVTVDGRWTSNDEWNDSSGTSMFTYPKTGQFPAEAYFRTKHNDQYLYLLLDFPTDTALEYNTETGYGDEAFITVDPNHDGSLTLRTDDFKVLLVWGRDGKLVISKSNWDGQRWQSAYSGAILGNSSLSQSPYSSNPHAIYECAIPLEYFLNSTTIGFALLLYDSQKAPYTEMLYPENFHSDAPSTWADLTFSTVVIPEFPRGFTSAILTISFCVVLLVVSKRRIHFKLTVP